MSSRTFTRRLVEQMIWDNVLELEMIFFLVELLIKILILMHKKNKFYSAGSSSILARNKKLIYHRNAGI